LEDQILGPGVQSTSLPMVYSDAQGEGPTGENSCATTDLIGLPEEPWGVDVFPVDSPSDEMYTSNATASGDYMPSPLELDEILRVRRESRAASDARSDDSAWFGGSVQR
jgi:hypothetical protein